MGANVGGYEDLLAQRTAAVGRGSLRRALCLAGVARDVVRQKSRGYHVPMSDNVFAQKLRYWRTRAGKSQGDVSRHLGCSRAYVSDVEAGKRGPMTEERIRSVARLLDVPVSVLLDAKAEVDGHWSIPVCQTPTHDRLASFFAATWKDLDEERLLQVEALFACTCDGCSAEPPGECYSSKR